MGLVGITNLEDPVLEQLAAHEALAETLLELGPIHLRQAAVVVRFEQQVDSAMNLETAHCQGSTQSGVNT